MAKINQLNISPELNANLLNCPATSLLWGKVCYANFWKNIAVFPHILMFNNV